MYVYIVIERDDLFDTWNIECVFQDEQAAINYAEHLGKSLGSDVTYDVEKWEVRNA